MSATHPKPQQRPGRSSRSQALLVLAPVLVLAALGWRGVRMSRAVALEAAENRARAEVARLLPYFVEQLHANAEHGLVRPYAFAPEPGEESQAAVRFRAITATDPADRETELSAVWNAAWQARTESGLPLRPLVAWQRLLLAPNPAEGRERAWAVGQAAVAEPSILTPELLARTFALAAENGWDVTGLGSWQSTWDWQESLRTACRRSGFSLEREGGPQWMDGEGDSWWATYDAQAGGWRFVSRERLKNFLRWPQSREADEFDLAVGPSVLLGGRALWPKPEGAVLLASGTQEEVACALWLVDLEQFFAPQRQQVRWLAGLLAVALGGLLLAWRALHSALRREQRLGEMKSDFVASVSHELRAPVSSMRLMAENLQAGRVEPETRRHEYHRLIAEECQRLSLLIENVLDFARLEQGRQSYDFAETDVAALVGDTVRLLEPRAQQRRQTIVAKCLPLDPAPCCDGLALRQALGNLLDNALKFSPPETEVRVRLEPAGAGAWLLMVADDGPGIPPSERERVFERFYRLGSELRRETPGAGIGLTLVRHIVEAHGGRIEISGPPGAIFTLTLPLQPPAADPCRES